MPEGRLGLDEALRLAVVPELGRPLELAAPPVLVEPLKPALWDELPELEALTEPDERPWQGVLLEPDELLELAVVAAVGKPFGLAPVGVPPAREAMSRRVLSITSQRRYGLKPAGFVRAYASMRFNLPA